MSSAKRFFFIIIVNAFILICGLLVFEGFLLFRDRDKPFHGVRDGREYTWGNLVRYNSGGFREREIVADDKASRIMVIGDSFTYGTGLREDERYTNLLERKLRKKYPTQNWQVLNFGIPGICTIQEKDILERYKDLVKPKRIIVGFCFNDVHPRGEFYSAERDHFDEVYGKPFYAFADFLGRIGLKNISAPLKVAYYKSAQVIGFFPNWRVALQRSYDPNSDVWKSFVGALKEIKRISDQMKLPPPVFAVLDSAVYTDWPTDYAHPDKKLMIQLGWYHQAERAAAEAGFVTVNFENEIIEKMPNEILAVNRWDWHSSARLNNIYAEKIFQVIDPSLQKKDPRPVDRRSAY